MSKRPRDFGSLLRNGVLKYAKTREDLIQQYIKQVGPIVVSDELINKLKDQLLSFANAGETSIYILFGSDSVDFYVINNNTCPRDRVDVPFLKMFKKFRSKIIDEEISLQVMSHVTYTYKVQLRHYLKHNLAGVKMSKGMSHGRYEIKYLLNWNCKCKWCVDSNHNPELYLLLLMRTCTKQPNVWNNVPKDICNYIIPLIRNEIVWK